MERPTHKLVGNERIELTDAEADAIMAEWEANINNFDDYKLRVTTEVQTFLDNTARQYWYDNMNEVAQFAYTENVWQNEAQQLLVWNATVWQFTQAHFDTNTITEGFVDTLPAFEYVIPPAVGVLNVATFENGQRSFNTPYKVSETRPANISVSVSISCVLSVSGGQSAKVELQISPDGITWTSKAECKNTATGTMQVGTQTNNITQTLQTDIPKNWFWRLKKTNLLSSPACAIEGGTETLY